MLQGKIEHKKMEACSYTKFTVQVLCLISHAGTLIKEYNIQVQVNQQRLFLHFYSCCPSKGSFLHVCLCQPVYNHLLNYLLIVYIAGEVKACYYSLCGQAML